MTLNDLFLLVKRYYRWVIAVPLICAMLAGGVSAIKDMSKNSNFTATVNISVVDVTGALSVSNLMLMLEATAQDVVANMESEGLVVEAGADEETQSVALAATADSSEEAASIVDKMATITADAFQEQLATQRDVYLEEAERSASAGVDTLQNAAGMKAAAFETCVVSVSPVAESSASGSSWEGAVKYVVIGFVGGLFIVILSLVSFDAVRRPIKSRDDIARITDLPVLNGSGGASGVELVRACLVTSCEGAPKTVCVVGEGACAMQFSIHLASAFEPESVDVVPVLPLESDAAGYFVAQDADATLVCVPRWKETSSKLLLTLEELKQARAKMIGLVLV